MFADDNFKFDEIGRKLSKRVENTAGSGEIARYEQFLLFPQCFQKACFPGASKGVIVWEWVKVLKPSESYSDDCHLRFLCSLILVYIVCLAAHGLNLLPNDKILDWSKSKAFADDKVNVTKQLILSQTGPCFHMSAVQVF